MSNLNSQASRKETLLSSWRKVGLYLNIESNKDKEFSEFTGKHFRIDNKTLKEDLSKKREEYDPRKHRLPNGVRKDLAPADAFAGKGVRIK